ncbi:GNAT family N-acetyltransferase [Pseudomonas sp. GD03858]|uniref:GNAT family N-acetyltransferase n=1 Tax=Pseudomonas sp. GD03858 TaxID=2975388 RepID=UPI00244910BA|nr:GNAT family N-acetyltransferase [Pseudomonas sp. GD03858]MDH0664896.1 GNAT family N-acetyltransferase [Pseudomonas sp. GD03858]
MIQPHPIKAQDWPLYRDLRLQALLDTPDAFGSTHAAEATRSDQAWQTRVEAALASANDQLWLAREGRTPCGLIWCRLSAVEPGVAELYQMWVSPQARGRGAGRALLRAALAWAGERQAREVSLGVTLADSPAMGLYRSVGFRAFGPPGPLREGSTLQVQEMRLLLARE